MYGASCSCTIRLAGSPFGWAFMAADNIHLYVDASKPGPKIDRNLFGQFAENLGHGLYGLQGSFRIATGISVGRTVQNSVSKPL